MLPSPPPASQASRYPFVLVLCVIVPAVMLAASILYGAVLEQRAVAREALQQAADRLATEVDAELDRSVAALKVLALSNALQRGDLRAFHELAARTVRGDPTWNNLQLISTDGHQLVNVRLPFGTVLPPLNRPELALQAVYKREPVVADLALGVVAQRMLTPIYVPVFRDGEVAYVIGAAIEPPNWQSMLRSTLPAEMQAVLLDRYAFVVTTTYDTVSPGELGRDFTGGGRMEVATQKSALSGWTVVTLMPRGALLPSQGWLLPATLSLLLLACGLAIGLGFAWRARQQRH